MNLDVVHDIQTVYRKLVTATSRLNFSGFGEGSQDFGCSNGMPIFYYPACTNGT